MFSRYDSAACGLAGAPWACRPWDGAMSQSPNIVSGVESAKTFRGAGDSDAAARQEAVHFLSEMWGDASQ